MSLMHKIARKFIGAFSEKQEVVADDFEFEHFLVYHGLIGTSPPGARQFKDVRADIRLAASSESYDQLAIALKVPPLYWEEKLKSIFAELEDPALAASLLAPQVESTDIRAPSTALFNQDWRARANAAVLLTFLNATQAVDTLIESLHDTAENTMLSFPHQAYALGKMGDKKAIEALSRYLSHDNSWMRADAMGALAQLTADEPFEPLMNALVVPHLLSDYSAIAVARQIAPQSLLTSDCEAAQAAGSAIIFGVIHASTATYTNDIVFETGVSECLPALTTLIKKAATPINIRAALALKDWIETADNRKYLDYDPKSELCYLSKFLEIDQIVELIIDKTLDPILDKPEELSCPLTASQAKSAVAIAGRLESSATGSRLVKMVTPEHPLLSEALDALSRLEHSEASTPLLDLALKLVDIEDRIAREPSKHPVKEQDETKSKHYWQALRAMGSVPTEPVQEFLLKASNDYAADKRQQALESLIRVSATLSASSKCAHQEKALARIEKALKDSSPEIRIVALSGLAKLGTVEDISTIMSLTEAKEVSVAKQALETLSELAKKGHKQRVERIVKQRLTTRVDPYQREKFSRLLARISD